MEPNTTTPINNQNFSPVSSSTPEKKVGPIIAILIIVLVLIIAALYLFASRTSEPTIPDDSTTLTDTAAESETQQEVQPVTGNSTNAASLQADLDAATNGLDNQNF